MEPKKQVYQFAVVSQDIAWGGFEAPPQGIYLTANGELYSFGHNENIAGYEAFESGKSYSSSYFSNFLKDSAEYLETIDNATHNKLTALATAVDATEFSDSLTDCSRADAYSIQFVSFKFDPDSGDYTAKLLDLRGDRQIVEISDEAKFLVEWLETKLDDYQLVGGDRCW